MDKKNTWDLNITDDGKCFLYLQRDSGILIEITKEQFENIKKDTNCNDINRLPF